MADLQDSGLRTRAELMAEYGLGRSTLEKWYRERAESGYPEAAGTVGRGEKVWDAAAFDAWYRSRGTAPRPPGLETRDELAARHGLSRHAMKQLWADRDTNGHPAPAHQEGRALYWDAASWDAWYAAHAKAQADADELVTMAEAGRMLGLAPSTVTVYASRPPAGWPTPAREQPLGGGRVRRLYRRADVLAYAERRVRP